MQKEGKIKRMDWFMMRLFESWPDVHRWNNIGYSVAFDYPINGIGTM